MQTHKIEVKKAGTTLMGRRVEPWKKWEGKCGDEVRVTNDRYSGLTISFYFLFQCMVFCHAGTGRRGDGAVLQTYIVRTLFRDG